MRSTLDIIIAVKESRPVEPEELRLALLALSSIDQFTKNSLDGLIGAIEEKAPRVVELKAHFAKQTRESMFQAMKRDPAAWLGPGGIPGNPEHDARLKVAKAVARAAGIDL